MHPLTPLLLSLLLVPPAVAFVFVDVTPPSFHGPSLKYGGAAVADLDGNGLPDFLVGYHGLDPVEVYFNFDGQFTRSPFSAGGDMHGFNPFRASPRDPAMRFTIARGGSRGNRPRSNVMFQVTPGTLEITNVTDASGITTRRGRGRSALFVDMALDPRFSRPDVIFTNSDISTCPSCEGSRQHPFRNLGNGRFEQVDIPGLVDDINSEGSVIDIDGDGVMEIILFVPGVSIYKLVAPYVAVDITADVLPLSAQNLRAARAVAEFDMDNDGDFDLYIACGAGGREQDLSRARRTDDILLENRGGVFVDVSETAGIPKMTISSGVTAADFNNDGYMDLFVTFLDQPGVLLRNRRDGTFRPRNNTIPLPEGVRGDMAQAVDYDADGRVDLMVSQGDRSNRDVLGMYRLFRNVVRGFRRRRRFVLVRVGSSPRNRAVSLHAVVTVTSGSKSWVRRVGSPGTAVSSSYIELVHVGIGRERVVDVSVRWANGEEEKVEGVRRARKIEVGRFGT